MYRDRKGITLALLDMDFPSSPLVLDASAVFNLLGSTRPVEVVQALGVDCYIEERTLKEIKRHPIAGLCHKEALASLQGFAGLRICRMSDKEYSIYLELVSGVPSDCLDDGESAAIAYAVEQNKFVILDDGKARRVLRARFPTTSAMSSLQMFMAAGVRAGWEDKKVEELVQAARRNARMNIVKGQELLFASLIEKV